MLHWLDSWLQNDNTKILYILTAIAIANIMDFVFGIVNAKLNSKVAFSSKKAKYGLLVKIGYFMALVYMIPLMMLLPDGVGLVALYTLYFGYLAIEVNSVLAHFRLADDDKRNDLFIDMINRIFKGGK